MKTLNTLAVTCWLAFVILTLGVVLGYTESWDQQCHAAATAFASAHSEHLKYAARLVTALGSLPIFAMLLSVVTALLVWKKHARTAVFAWSAALISAGGIALLKLLIDRVRPEMAADDVFTASFPSGHSGLSVVFGLTVIAIVQDMAWPASYRSWASAIMASTVIAVGMSRLYLGLHYPTDVLGGWLLGLACIATSYRIYRGYRS